MNTMKIREDWLWLAFLTASASAIYTIESYLMRLLPLPFIRLGLSNIVVLYLVSKNHIGQAFVVNAAKSILGGIFTFTLLSPAVLISLLAGIMAIIGMSLASFVRPRFSLFGISIVGAICHNITQLALVRMFIITKDGLFVLTPFLLFLALMSGFITAFVCMYIEEIEPSMRPGVK